MCDKCKSDLVMWATQFNIPHNAFDALDENYLFSSGVAKSNILSGNSFFD